MTTVTISLPESLKLFVDTEVAAKGYGNVSEYFRGLLRDAQSKAQDARLEVLLLEGLASGRVPVDQAFRDRLAARADQVIGRHKDRA